MTDNRMTETARECSDDEIVYGFQFCGEPSSMMLGETMFDYNGEPVGWIVANGLKGDCGHAGTDVPIIVTDHDSKVTIDQYRETHMETMSEQGQFKQTLKLDTYVTYAELRELIAVVMGVDSCDS